MAAAAEGERARFQAAMSLVDRALDLPASEREALLERECQDPALREEARRLLSADAREDDRLSVPAGARLPGALRELASAGLARAEAGMTVGPFRLRTILGRGGMGEVWTADRVGADFEQSVALKLLYVDGQGRAVEARFRRERQILARLEHPRIARLLDGGISADGRPWLAMELVTGLSLVDHCVSAGLGIEERLELFLQVCEAVQFAHQNLVIHRDLKPSNILVDERGAPKLLDFGIAKLIEDDGDATALTALGEQPMTPDYASPEQTRHEPVTTASDTWTLGAILHELLAGVRADRALLDTTRARPSARIDVDHRPSWPAGMSRSALTKRLKGDLDAIVTKATRSDPKERYPSVDALAGDVRRHLGGLPVAARGEATGYFLRSFVRRHRLGVGLSALAILSLVAGLFGTVSQARHAREEARKAAQTREFVVNLLEGFDPYQQGGKPVTQHDILVRGELRLAELDDQPEAQGQLLRVFAQTWTNMGELERARSTAERALSIQRRALGPRHIELARTLIVLGAAEDIPGDWEDAERAYVEALSIARDAEGPAGPTALEALSEVAYIARERGSFAESERLYLEQLTLLQRLHGNESKEALETRGDIAALLCDAGRLEESASMSREVAKLDAAVFGENHPGTLIVRGNLARALIELGQFDAADTVLRDVYARQVDVVGEISPYALNTRRLRARALDGLGRPDEAIPLFEQILRSQEELRGQASIEVARTLAPESVALWHAGRLREAEAAARRALAIQAPRVGEPHTAARTRTTLGVVLLDEGRLDESLTELEGALAVQERMLPPNHHDLLATRTALARARARAGDAGR
jgi:serine/threonine-protein kinase